MNADKQNQISKVHPYLQNQFALMINPVTGTFKFRRGEEIKHVASGAFYIIAGLPNETVIEATREAAYGYIMPDGRMCVRSQELVEDGRFESAEPGSAATWYNEGTNYQDWLAKAGPRNDDPMAPTPHSKKVSSAIDFDQFVEFGIKANPRDLHNGYAWSFRYKDHAVTHENDNCYLIADGKNTLRFERGDMLLEVEGQLVVSRVNV
jgi:hypothetical protein